MVTEAKYIISSPDVKDCPKSELPEYAFIGRSNVGKSSLINMLCHDPKLAKTSQKPGKTLLINHFAITSNGQHWHLVDLPGYGYAQAGKEQREKLSTMIRRYCGLREELVSLFVLLDSRHEPQQIDVDFMNWLGENEIPFAMVFTKADKLGPVRLKENIEAYKAKMLEQWEELPPVFVTSAEKNVGGDELLAYIEEINDQVRHE